MNFVLQLWQWMLIMLAGCVNQQQQQQQVVEPRRIEDAVLKERFGKQRIFLTEDGVMPPFSFTFSPTARWT